MSRHPRNQREIRFLFKLLITVPFFIVYLPLLLFTVFSVCITVVYDWVVGNRFAHTEWPAYLVLANDYMWRWYVELT